MPTPENKARITLLHGKDEFAISQKVAKLCSGLGGAGAMELNTTRFDGRLGLDLEELNTAINALSFLAPRRVVVVENPRAAFPARPAGKKGAGASAGSDELPEEISDQNQKTVPEDPQHTRRKKFLGLLENAQPDTAIILVEYEALGEKDWLKKWADQSKPQVTVELQKLPYIGEMPGWIAREARHLGGSIMPDAAEDLVAMVGDNTRQASLELEKLLTYVDRQRPVNRADVEKLSTGSGQANIFKFVDALAGGNVREAQKMLHRLLETEESQFIWGMLIRQFRLLLQTRVLLDEGARSDRIQKELKLQEFQARALLPQAGRFTIGELEAIYHRLLEIEVAAKDYSKQVPLEVSLDLFVVNIKGY
jgi:DNA polymerase-3 subunit delta